MTDLEKERVNSEGELFFSGAWDRFVQSLRGRYNYYDARTIQQRIQSLSLSHTYSLTLTTALYG